MKSKPKEQKPDKQSAGDDEKNRKKTNHKEQAGSQPKKRRKCSPKERKDALKESLLPLDKHRQLIQSRRLKTKKKKVNDKGKSFRSSLLSLDLAPDIGKTEDPTVETPSEQTRSRGEEVLGEEMSEEVSGDETSVNKRSYSAPGQPSALHSGASKMRKGDSEEIGVQYVISSDDENSEDVSAEMDVSADVKRRNDNFIYPRRILGQAMFPDTDHTLTDYEICSTSSGTVITDAVSVDRLPPLSVLKQVDDEIKRTKNMTSIAKLPFHGNFDLKRIRILQRFHHLKCLREETSFEKTWLKTVFASSKFEKEVTHALLDRWNNDGTYLAEYQNYRISSQELSLLCGERYLSDEIINFVTQKYCDKANESTKACNNILLPSFLSSGCVLRNVVESICLHYNMQEVVTMFLPVHMVHECHWGLAIFSVKEKSISFDDGYHYAIPEDLRRNACNILSIMHQVTGSESYQPSKWSEITRFQFPFPDQPQASAHSATGCGSCGVAVVCAVRDICAGKTTNFTWTYKDAPRLRAELMVEILNLS